METLGDQNSQEPRKAANGAKVLAVVVPFLGLAAVIGGVVTTLVGGTQPVSFGWVGYAPLAADPFSASGFALIGPLTQAGLVVGVAGLVLLAFWAGLLLGRRRPATQ